mgnify:FL=1
MSPWVSELNRLEHHLWTARVSMRKLPCTQLRSSFFILAATFSLEILGFEAAATEKKPEYGQTLPHEIGFKFDQLYESGVVPNYVVDIPLAEEEIYFRVGGETKLGVDVSVSEDAFASKYKPIVSTVLLKLIESGKRSLEDPLSNFSPQFESMLVAQNGNVDIPFKEADKPITTRQLLTHTSGLIYPPQMLGMREMAQQSDDHGYYFWCGAANTGFWIDTEQQLNGVFMAQHNPNLYNSILELADVVRKLNPAR